MKPIHPTLVQLLIAVLVLACAVFWWRDHNAQQQSNEVGKTVIATPAKEVANVPKVDVEVKKPVKVYKGGASLKEGIKLPTEVIKDDAQQVIASSKIDGRDDHPKTVTTVINTETGESETYVRTDPLPWLAFDDRGHVGVGIGLKKDGPAMRFDAKQTLIDIKSLRLSGEANFDISQTGNTDWMIMAHVGYYW